MLSARLKVMLPNLSRLSLDERVGARCCTAVGVRFTWPKEGERAVEKSNREAFAQRHDEMRKVALPKLDEMAPRQVPYYDSVRDDKYASQVGGETVPICVLCGEAFVKDRADGEPSARRARKAETPVDERLEPLGLRWLVLRRREFFRKPQGNETDAQRVRLVEDADKWEEIMTTAVKAEVALPPDCYERLQTLLQSEYDKNPTVASRYCVHIGGGDDVAMEALKAACDIPGIYNVGFAIYSEDQELLFAIRPALDRRDCVQLHCGHVFHRECLQQMVPLVQDGDGPRDQWLPAGARPLQWQCPTCRKPLSALEWNGDLDLEDANNGDFEYDWHTELVVRGKDIDDEIRLQRRDESGAPIPRAEAEDEDEDEDEAEVVPERETTRDHRTADDPRVYLWDRPNLEGTFVGAKAALFRIGKTPEWIDEKWPEAAGETPPPPPYWMLAAQANEAFLQGLLNDARHNPEELTKLDPVTGHPVAAGRLGAWWYGANGMDAILDDDAQTGWSDLYWDEGRDEWAHRWYEREAPAAGAQATAQAGRGRYQLSLAGRQVEESRRGSRRDTLGITPKEADGSDPSLLPALPSVFLHRQPLLHDEDEDERRDAVRYGRYPHSGRSRTRVARRGFGASLSLDEQLEQLWIANDGLAEFPGLEAYEENGEPGGWRESVDRVPAALYVEHPARITTEPRGTLWVRQANEVEAAVMDDMEGVETAD